MSKDIIDLMEKSRQGKNNRKIRNIAQRNQGTRHEAMDKWIYDKWKNIAPYNRSSEQPMYKTI